MMEKSISFATDSEGFLSQECPACSGRFMVKLGEGSDEPISFCPYCCHMGRDCWWTQEQAKYIEDSTAQMASEAIGTELEKMARKFNRKAGSGFINMTMKTKRSKTPTPRAPEEMELEIPMYLFDCCGETIKHDKSEARLFCIICGKEHSDLKSKDGD